MFEDFEDENVDVTPDSPDRTIVWAIHSRGDAGLTPEEAWAILHERYPDDPRFLLLNTYSELNESRKEIPDKREAAPKGETAGVWTPSYFLKKVERVLSGNADSADGATDALHPQLRDLVVFGGAVLATAKGDDAKMLTDLRAKIGLDKIDGAAEPLSPAKIRDERDRAGLKLRRFEREVVKELHDRTQDNQPLGVRATAAPASSPHNDWASVVADNKDKPRRKYAADARFERGELIEHVKFGVGVVTGLEPGKAIILFESGTRKLIAGA
jgi:hypothetical protein